MSIARKSSFSKEAAFIEKSLQLLKEHSVETYAHSIRVGSLAAGIAQFNGMDSDRVEQLRVCGLLHDIGKLMIPKEILAKESELTPLEYEQVKTHPLEGYHMVKQHFSNVVSDAVLFHHERMDGSGYPYGLSSDTIPLEAHIIMLADCFDAMTVKRAYKPAITSEEALNELRALCGKYDIALYEALENIVSSEKD